MSGWIKLHRKILESDLWTRPFDLRLFMLLLLNANHSEEPYKKNGITLQKGQYVRSYRKLGEDLIYEENAEIIIPPTSSVQASINRLIKKGMILKENTGLCTVFTVVNYEEYQSANTGLRTDFVQYQEDKNILINNKLLINNMDKKKFKIPTVQEISNYCSERKNSVNPEKFFDYNESKGWIVGKTKMKNWKAAVRTWEKNTSFTNQISGKTLEERQEDGFNF